MATQMLARWALPESMAIAALRLTIGRCGHNICTEDGKGAQTKDIDGQMLCTFQQAKDSRHDDQRCA